MKKNKTRPTFWTKEQIINFILEGKVIVTVTSVAPSGMSRTMKFGVMNDYGGISNITDYISLLYKGYYNEEYTI